MLGVFLGSKATLEEGRLSADAWRSFVVNGVAQGSVYALIAMGYTLVAGILYMINFAHGEVFMTGTFISFFFARAMAEAGFLNESPLVSIPVLLLISMSVSTSVALLLERVAYRPLRGAPRLVPLITAIGASLFLQYSFRGFFGARVAATPPSRCSPGTSRSSASRSSGTRSSSSFRPSSWWWPLYFFLQRTRTRPLDASRRGGPRDRRPDGDPRRPGHRHHVRHRRHAGGAAGILYVLLFPQVDFP